MNRDKLIVNLFQPDKDKLVINQKLEDKEYVCLLVCIYEGK